MNAAQNIWTVLWVSFLVAGVAEGAFFTLIDPQLLYFLGEPVHFSTIGTYSIGFFFFWFLCLVSGMVTYLLIRTDGSSNDRQSDEQSIA
jgi:hypothetical protein